MDGEIKLCSEALRLGADLILTDSMPFPSQVTVDDGGGHPDHCSAFLRRSRSQSFATGHEKLGRVVSLALAEGRRSLALNGKSESYFVG